MFLFLLLALPSEARRAKEGSSVLYSLLLCSLVRRRSLFVQKETIMSQGVFINYLINVSLTAV
jgi:hypothetical protein